MSIQNELNQIERDMNTLQQQAENLLMTEIDNTDNAMQKLQLKDMYKIIESDVKCRINLESLENVIPKVSFSDESYDTFINYSKEIIEQIKDFPLPHEFGVPIKAAQRAVNSAERCTLQEVFTITSILITCVALCFTKIDKEQLCEIIEKLDALLETKERQLNLIIQMSKWRSEYIN